MVREEVYRLIDQERQRQDSKWHREFTNGIWNSESDVKFRILAEEVGEIAHALNEHDYRNLFEELIQSAAVLVSWIESDYEA